MLPHKWKASSRIKPNFRRSIEFSCAYKAGMVLERIEVRAEVLDPAGEGGRAGAARCGLDQQPGRRGRRIQFDQQG